MDKERERQIGIRLRAFRESLQIPRSKFAVAVGFGSERLASYEGGRAPLLYDVFRAISARYRLNPGWLATGVGSPQWYEPIDDADFSGSIKARAPFSEVYETHIKPRYDQMASDSRLEWSQLCAALDRITQSLPRLPRTKSNRSSIKKEIHRLEELMTMMKKDLRFRGKVNEHIRHVLELTDAETDPILSGNMKLQLPSLLEQLKKATATPGKKTELAKFLGAPLASVSRWLSGDREPGGEVVLQMQAWLKRPT